MIKRPLLYKCFIAVALVFIFYLSDSIGIELDISDLLGGLLC